MKLSHDEQETFQQIRRDHAVMVRTVFKSRGPRAATGAAAKGLNVVGIDLCMLEAIESAGLVVLNRIDNDLFAMPTVTN